MTLRHALVLASTALLLAAAATAGETPKCSDLGDSPLEEPEWHLLRCSPRAAHSALRNGASKAGSDFAYALDVRQNANNFVRHTLADFPGQTIVGGNADDILGLDFDPTATTLYGLNDTTAEFGTINLSTGAFTAIGPSIPKTNHTWTGLSIHPVTGVVYASSNGLAQESSLYTINPTTGAATLIGTDTDLDIVVDIAVNCLGVIYAHDVVTDSIYTLNPANGQGTLVGPTGVDANFAQGMDFDNQSGVLYAYLYEGSGRYQYGTIDPASGHFTRLLLVNDPLLGDFEGATQTTCGGVSPLIFTDGFESGNTSRWQ